MAAEDPISGGLAQLLGGLTGGLVLAGLLALALKTFADKLGEGMYGLVTTLPRRGFERIALLLSEDTRITRYRTGIPDRYGRHVLTRQRQIDVESVYVHLQYEQGGQRHDLRGKVLAEKAVLLLGEAGAGKSLLSKYLLLRWAEQPRKVRAAQPIPVLVELHRCTGEVDLVGLIATRFRLPRDADEARAREFVLRRLDQGRMRLIFDGLDEVAADHQAAVVSALETFRQSYTVGEQANSVMVTCRGSAYTGSLSAFEPITIADFDDSSILRFLERWLAVERSPTGGLTEAEAAELGTAESLFHQIRQHPQLHQLARTPLLLSLLADLYTGSLLRRGRTLPGSRAAFYSRVTDHMITRDLLLDRGERASPYEPGDKLTVLRRIALTMTETPAAEGDRLVIDRQRLRAVVSEALGALDLRAEYDRELVRDLLDRSQTLVGSDTGERYWFPHRSFQEYFTARALAGPTGVARLLAGYRCDPAFWRDTVRFWCGLDGNECSEVVRELFDAEDARDRVLALECLAEASAIDQSLADRIVTHFLAELPVLHHDSDADGVGRALGTVAARDTDRGRRVRERLELAASRGVAAAVDCLARTGRPDAARYLVSLAGSSPTPEHARFIRAMGDVAVPALAAAVTDDRIWPLDILGEIATPSAALELSRFLWAGGPLVPPVTGRGEGVATRAAWWIAVLLREAGIETVLQERGHVDRALEIYEQVWVPFTHDPHGRLARIAGRVGYAIEFSEPPPGIAIERIDPRIGIFLAARTFLQVPYLDSPDELGRMTPERTEYLMSAEQAMIRARRANGEVPQAVFDHLREHGIPESRIRLLRSFPNAVQHALLKGLTDLILSYPEDEAEAAALWSRAARDAEHHTRHLHLAAQTAVGFVALVIAGVGGYRVVSTVRHSWQWGPTWLAWAILIVGPLSLAGWIVSYVLEEIVVTRTDFDDALVFSGVGLFAAMVAVAPAATATLADWFGWPATILGLALPTAMGIAAEVRAGRLDRESNNPYREIMHRFQHAYPAQRSA
ncbi:NACHT domain-containing protein [Nocardia sp. CDC159]|uniref:NACHT domain-containing protein n=1 Tax=Nocardia pulmonis TaxID=2951408 RepID=A0A9X2E242_9NOCA|nr:MULTISPECIES: NACHT domain-containing protein [Nocardia]MCM6772191.1 NACHT domain-containing protein [Nocardia pulmonis]MCM6785151.1 NACHT domain-containing protein [Nocardia sp. CDC159]